MEIVLKSTLNNTFYLISLEILEKPDSQWNERLQSSPYGTIYQTKEYGSYIQSRLKAKPLYLTFISKNGELVSQLLGFQTFLGKGKITKSFGRGFLYSSISKFQSILPKFLFWTYGPIILDDSFNTEIYESLATFLNSWKGRFRGVLHPLNPLFDLPNNFNFKQEKTGTFIIDLTHNIETILKKTDKHSVQKNIKRSSERGVTVTRIESDNDILAYYNLLKSYRTEQNHIPYSKQDVIEGFKMLKKVGCDGFLAWYKGEQIGGISFTSFNGYINESGIARSQIDKENNLYSQDLLRWNIIKWGTKNNFRYYDLSGVKPDNQTQKEAGIFRNKKKWGGTLYKYGIFKK